jgi:hypothetical protein
VTQSYSQVGKRRWSYGYNTKHFPTFHPFLSLVP